MTSDIDFHLLNVEGQLPPLLVAKIEASFQRGISAISKLLPISGIDVVVGCGSSVIEETGLVGYSPSEKEVQITIDPKNKNLMKNFDMEFIATLGHEMHHCLRRRGPGFGEKLAELLVTEGLACHFETELRNGNFPFYATALNEVQLCEIWRRAKTILNDSKANYREWFFGSVEKSIPRHTGYCLGFCIVSRYIHRHGCPASQLWNKAAKDFYEGDWQICDT